MRSDQHHQDAERRHQGTVEVTLRQAARCDNGRLVAANKLILTT